MVELKLDWFCEMVVVYVDWLWMNLKFMMFNFVLLMVVVEKMLVCFDELICMFEEMEMKLILVDV